jgi:putative phosphoesterase
MQPNTDGQKHPEKIGVISDAHGNGPAFELAVKVLTDLGATAFWFLGDSVGYIPSLSVLDSIRAMGRRIRCITGNHEKMLLHGGIDADRDKVYQLSLVRSMMSPCQLSEIESWPAMERLNSGGRRILFLHGSPLNVTNGYVYPDTDLGIFFPEADIVFMGNTHRPFIREDKGITYVNVGSCGLPRDDGSLGSAALFNPFSGQVQILRFNIELETGRAISDVPFVHESVIEVFSRRPEAFLGNVL